MAQELEPDEFADSTAQPAPRWSLLSWLWDGYLWSFLTLGFIVFELTSNVFLGGVATCLKFGGSDFLSAGWARHDPNQKRAGAMSPFCLASGCFRIAGASFVACLVLAVVEGFFRVPFNVDRMIAVFCLIFGGVFLGLVATLFGCNAASRAQCKIWLDEKFNAARRYRRFPPVYIGRRNSLFSILATASLTVGAFVAGFLYFLAFEVQAEWQKNPGQVMWVCSIWALFLSWLVWQLSRGWRIIARTPEECWPELVENGDYFVEEPEVEPDLTSGE